MPNFAQATVVGHIGRDAETRFTADGKSVTNFSLAVSHGYGDKKETDWWRVVGFRLDKVSQYLLKGKAVLVSGTPRLKSYEKDGQKVNYAEIVAQDVKLLGGGDGESKPAPAKPQPEQGKFVADDSDVPF